jgi:DNA-binding transcriptional MerR regulator
MALGLDESLSRSLPDRDEWPTADPAPAGIKPCTVGEMAREFGTTPRALRFYESKGLLSPQRQGAARFYGAIERERLSLVLKAKRLGFTLREIHRMLGSEHAEFGALSITRRQCFDQIKLLEARKREIETALAELRHTYSSFYARLAAGAG